MKDQRDIEWEKKRDREWIESAKADRFRDYLKDQDEDWNEVFISYGVSMFGLEQEKSKEIYNEEKTGISKRESEKLNIQLRII